MHFLLTDVLVPDHFFAESAKFGKYMFYPFNFALVTSIFDDV